MNSKGLNLLLCFVFITFFSCEKRAIKLTQKRIEGIWIETNPCSYKCDTLTFEELNQFNSSHWPSYNQYSLLSEDTLKIESTNSEAKFLIEFSNDYNELIIFNFDINLIGTRNNVFYIKEE